MKKILFFICVLLLSSCNIKSQETSFVSATSYIVIEKSSNKILEGFNYYESRSVASISKIMTAIVTIENTDVYKEVTVPDEALKTYGSCLYLTLNQKISVIDLLYGLMLRSGNDAAITLAVSTAGDVNTFVKMMNEKANKLNMKNTYFSNPHGLDEEDGGNISSAYDMAILYSYCMENPLFKEIVKSKSYLTYTNKNRLLKTYEYCTGGKTGFTKKAKRTLVTSAKKNDIDLIIVTLNCGSDFQTHKNIYEYYFNNYTAIKILNKGINSFDNTSIYISKDYYFITNLDYVNLYYEIKNKEKRIKITLLDRSNNIVDYLEIYF